MSFQLLLFFFLKMKILKRPLLSLVLFVFQTLYQCIPENRICHIVSNSLHAEATKRQTNFAVPGRWILDKLTAFLSLNLTDRSQQPASFVLKQRGEFEKRATAGAGRCCQVDCHCYPPKGGNNFLL